MTERTKRYEGRKKNIQTGLGTNPLAIGTPPAKPNIQSPLHRSPPFFFSKWGGKGGERAKETGSTVCFLLLKARADPALPSAHGLNSISEAPASSLRRNFLAQGCRGFWHFAISASGDFVFLSCVALGRKLAFAAPPDTKWIKL